jgi:hypothetical protein
MALFCGSRSDVAYVYLVVRYINLTSTVHFCGKFTCFVRKIYIIFIFFFGGAIFDRTCAPNFRVKEEEAIEESLFRHGYVSYLMKCIVWGNFGRNF